MNHYPDDSGSIEAIVTTAAPAAIGAYSQATATNRLIFVSGQLPLDPASGALVTGGVENQARQALSNIAAILDAGGASMEDVVKTTVLLADLDAFDAVNTVYAGFFDGAVPPARATFQVARLPRGASVEIEAVAVRSGA